MRILGACNDFNQDIIQCISDTLFKKQITKEFYLSKENCNLDTTFLYYSNSYSLLDYIAKSYNSNQEFIETINTYRDINGILLSIDYGYFRVIASNEELKLIYDNQSEPVIPLRTIIPEDHFAYDD